MVLVCWVSNLQLLTVRLLIAVEWLLDVFFKSGARMVPTYCYSEVKAFWCYDLTSKSGSK